MMFGRGAQLTIAAQYRVNPDADLAVTEFLEERESRMRGAYQFVRRNILDNQKRQKDYHDRMARKVSFKVGDHVWCFSPVVGMHNCKKSTGHWHGPFEVVAIVDNDVNYVIRRAERQESSKTWKVHVERLWQRTIRVEEKLFGVPVCSDQHYPVWEKLQYEPADVVGPPNDINGGPVVNQVTTVRLTEPTRNVTWCEESTFNGHGDFLAWVKQLEDARRNVQNEFQRTPETLEFFLTGKALQIYGRLIGSKLDDWEVCKAEMAKRLALKTEADFFCWNRSAG
jgi:hypothetical protein